MYFPEPFHSKEFRLNQVSATVGNIDGQCHDAQHRHGENPTIVRFVPRCIDEKER
jgi:hypothetical protein